MTVNSKVLTGVNCFRIRVASAGAHHHQAPLVVRYAPQGEYEPCREESVTLFTLAL